MPDMRGIYAGYARDICGMCAGYAQDWVRDECRICAGYAQDWVPDMRGICAVYMNKNVEYNTDVREIGCLMQCIMKDTQH